MPLIRSVLPKASPLSAADKGLARPLPDSPHTLEFLDPNLATLWIVTAVAPPSPSSTTKQMVRLDNILEWLTVTGCGRSVAQIENK